MKTAYNQQQHEKRRQLKINTGFKFEDYKQDVEKILYYTYGLGYTIHEINYVLDEVKNVVTVTLEKDKESRINDKVAEGLN